MNPYRHFYLYAKGWYETENCKYDDLKIILGDYCGIDPKYLNEDDVVNVLLKLAYKHIKTEFEFDKFIERLFWRDNYAKTSFADTLRKDIKKDVIDSCLSTLANTKVSEIEGDIGEKSKELENKILEGIESE